MSDRREEFMSAIQPHLDGLFATALRLSGSRSDAEDLVQEGVLHAYQAWDRFETGSNVRAWLQRIVLNGFISGYRRRKRERRALDLEADPSRRSLLLSESQVACESRDGGIRFGGLGRGLRDALDALPAEYRVVVIMSDLAEMSYRDIANALECPIGTVMSRLHRGRRALAASVSASLASERNEFAVARSLAA